MQLTKSEHVCFIDDGAKRGPLTMFRVRFHRTEAKLFAQCADRRLAMWDLATEPQPVKGKKEPCLVGELLCPHEIGWVRGFDVHPQGTHIITGGSDRTLRLWQYRDGRPGEIATATMPAHDGWVEAVAYSPDGSRVSTAGADGVVKVWEATDLRLVTSLSGHSRHVADVQFSPDGKWLLSAAEDGLVIIRDTETFTAVRTIEFGCSNDQFGQTPRHSGVHRFSISHDSHWLAVAGGEKLDVYDLSTGEIVATERLNMDVQFHPEQPLLLGGESEIRAWEYEPAKFAPPETDKNGKPKAAAAMTGNLITSIKRGDWSLGMGFSSDGQRLDCGRADGCVELYDVA